MQMATRQRERAQWSDAFSASNRIDLVAAVAERQALNFVCIPDFPLNMHGNQKLGRGVQCISCFVLFHQARKLRN
jgi:hypothetical protein